MDGCSYITHTDCCTTNYSVGVAKLPIAGYLLPRVCNWGWISVIIQNSGVSTIQVSYVLKSMEKWS